MLVGGRVDTGGARGAGWRLNFLPARPRRQGGLLQLFHLSGTGPPYIRGMSRPSGSGRRDFRSWIVLAALVLPVAFLLLSGVRTWQAERRYAAAARQVAHDYAAIAAWQYARRANMALHDEVMHAFVGIATGHRRTSANAPLESPAVLLAARGRRAAPLLDRGRFAFTFHAGQRRLDVAGARLDAPTRAMLERRLAALSARRPPDGEPHRMLFDSAGGVSYAIAVWVLAGPDRPVAGVYGVASDPAALASRLTALAREPGLLPGVSASSGGDIVVRLTRADGAVVFATPGVPGVTAATDSSGLQWGELHTTVDLSPRLAGALIAAGAASSQLPSLGVMLLLATVLAAVGVLQLRRGQELTRLRARFVANVSHELRTPLAQISMFAETLALGRERSVSEGRRFASIIHGEAIRMAALVESVLRFSRLESGRETLRPEPLTLAPEIGEAVTAFAPIAELAGVGLELDLEEITVPIDRAAFRQIVLNLLDNAVKHGGRGHRVHVTLARVGADAVLTVDDEGPGVPPAWRERIFEPFARVERNGVAGAGIGLAVVRELVTAHAGRVSVDDSPRGGARFVVTLPAAVAQALTPAEAAR